jgi:hypothetical protein
MPTTRNARETGRTRPQDTATRRELERERRRRRLALKGARRRAR